MPIPGGESVNIAKHRDWSTHTQIRFADDDEPGLDELVDEIGIRGWSHTMQRPRTASRLHSELRNRCDVVLGMSAPFNRESDATVIP